MKKNNKTDVKSIKNINARITNVKFLIDANPDVYDNNEYYKICDIVDHMSREIWIDKTYVAFKGSIWKDAFLDEKKWYELIEMIKPQIEGKKIPKMDVEIIALSWAMIVITYMYDILEKYGYDISEIDLGLSKKHKMRVEYFNDTRTTWES